MNEIVKLFLSLSVSGSLISLILFGLKTLLKDRFSKTWHYYIWLVVIVRLILPFAIHNGFVGTLFTNEVNYPVIYSGKSIEEQSWPVSADDVIHDLQFTTYRDDIKSYIWILWISIATLLFVRKVTGYNDFIRFIKAGRHDITDNNVRDIYFKACKALNINKPMKLYMNKMAVSPMLAGVIKPFIVLPGFELPDNEIYNIFIHELTHYKRMDIIYKWFTQLAVCLHWYNPLVYLISREINKYCELSCDEKIIKTLDAYGKKQYGNTLITSLRLNGNYGDTIVSVTLNEDGKLLKERLGAIMKYKKKAKLTVILSSFFTFAIICGALATGAYAAPNSQINNYSHKENLYENMPFLNEADKRGIEIMQFSGTWGMTMEEVLPHMTNAGIDIAVEIYNQKHPEQEKLAENYYNSINYLENNIDSKNEEQPVLKTSADIKKSLNEADKAAIELMEYSGSWEIVELLLPNMSEHGIDKLVELYNQKNQYSGNKAKKSGDYYTVTGDDADIRALTMMRKNGMWKYVEPLIPYMSNHGIDKMVTVFNQKHKGQEKTASDYYNN